MERESSLTLADELAAAQEWWREAGVDCAFADEAASWLAESPEPGAPPEPAAAARPAAPPPAPQIGGDPGGWPGDLAAFAQWWLTEPSLAAGGTRVPPRGPAGAKLMALVPQPEAGDRERLLSGEQGALLANFLRRAEIDESEVYVAAALPRHMPMADWREQRRLGLDKVLRHHIELAAPKRVIVLGQDILSLLGHDPAQKPAFLLDFNQQRGSVPALAARSLDHMVRIPQDRNRLWRDWQDWTDGTS
jgi:DNA polymerase